MSKLAVAELTAAERHRLSKDHPELRGDQPAWIVSSEALAQIQALVAAWVRAEEDFQGVVEAMIPRTEIPTPAVVLQARRNAEARDALIREFGLLSSSDIADLAGSTAKNRAASANRWKQEGRIFSVPWRGSDLWPGFQFDVDGRPHTAVADVLSVLRPEASGWEKALWFISANGWLEGRRPVDLFAAEQDAVVEAARREAEELFF